jgi:hypothetical protein
MDLEAYELVLLRRPDDARDYPDEDLERIQQEHHDLVLPDRHDEPARPRRHG